MTVTYSRRAPGSGDTVEPQVDGAMSMRHAGWQVGTFRRRLWWWTLLGWTAFANLPLLTGWLLKQVFDTLADHGPVYGWLTAIGLSEMARIVVFALSVWVVVRWWVGGLALLRTNMLHAQTVSGGPERADLPLGPAEAISRFQDDTRNAVLWADSWLDGFGYAVYTVAALVIMALVNPTAGLVAVVPVVAVTLITIRMRPLLHAAVEADREASGRVAGFLGEAFAGQLAFRLAGRERSALARLDRHNATRRKTAVRHVVLEQALDGLTSTTADVSIGLMLLALVPSMRSGETSIGDVALLATYAVQLGEAPRFFARLVTAREQARVSFGRMAELVAPDRPGDLLVHRPVCIDTFDDPVLRDRDPERVGLDQLSVRGLTARYRSTGGGIESVDMDIRRGEFVVVTGPVGSGKSTLLRALAGLVPVQAGTVTWNGEPIEDLGAWFVPPQAAHLPQVPRLFSESLAENILLGRDLVDRVDPVVELTALRADLADMPDGLDTKVGARGLRLSGGQTQRVATARSLLTGPELLIVDDLSSALDVETERALWKHVRAGGMTVLAVSHRAFVLDFADRVITLG